MASFSDEVKEGLSQAFHEGDVEAAVKFTKQALGEGADPLDIIQNILVPTLTDVGVNFQDMKIFLPELMASGEAATAAGELLEEAIAASGVEVQKKGKVLMGTVENDVHDIGKNIVCTMLNSHGFEVIDLGRNVSPVKFMEAAEKEEPDIVGMSTLMTTTRPATGSTIKLFDELNMRGRHKLIIGGGSVDQAYADKVDADGYSDDAAGAVEVCNQLMEAFRKLNVA